MYHLMKRRRTSSSDSGSESDSCGSCGDSSSDCSDSESSFSSESSDDGRRRRRGSNYKSNRRQTNGTKSRNRQGCGCCKVNYRVETCFQAHILIIIALAVNRMSQIRPSIVRPIPKLIRSPLYNFYGRH